MKLPASIMRRLPRYYRYARELIGTDVLRISSSELSAMMGLTASQIRQDLSMLGEFGQQGYGYNVREIYDGIGEILGVNRGWSVIIVGMDAIGIALACHPVFLSRGIRLSGLFDYDASVGKNVAGVRVAHIMEMAQFCRDSHVDIAALCVPREQAEEACALAISGGVKGIWNFTGAELRPERSGHKAAIRDINLGDCLLGLCGELNNTSDIKSDEKTI